MKINLLSRLKDFKEVIVIVIFFITTAFAFDALYARDTKVEMIAMRLEQKIQADRMNDIQGMIWKLQDRYKCVTEVECLRVMDSESKDLYRKLLMEYREIEKSLQEKK